MKKKLLLTVLILLVGGLIFFNQKIPHRLLGKYLSPSDNLIPADAIVAVSGDDDRIKHAIELYKQGYASKLILSGAAKEGFTSNAKAMQLEASKSGIPNEAIILEEKSYNTYENALYTKEIVLSQRIESIILVTSPYHQRRAFETFKNIFRGTNIKLQNSPSQYSSWKIDSWWKSDRERHLTQDEAIKVFWAKITGNYK